MLSVDPRKSRALLIGASVFPQDRENLPALPAVRFNIVELARILESEDIIGFPHSNIELIIDNPHAQEIAERVAQFGDEAEDTLIVYYSGHGLIANKSRELLLATRNSTETGKDFNSLRFSQLREAMQRSAASKKLLILDCCFSGRAVDLMSNPQELIAANSIHGVCMLTSSSANAPSIAPVGAKHTAFTGLLINTIDDGLEKEGEVISVERLFDSVKKQMLAKGLPEPQMANVQDGGKLNIVKNRFNKSPKARLDALEDLLKNRMSNSDVLTSRLAEQFAAMEAMIQEWGAHLRASDSTVGRLSSQIAASDASLKAKIEALSGRVEDVERRGKVHAAFSKSTGSKKKRPVSSKIWIGAIFCISLVLLPPSSFSVARSFALLETVFPMTQMSFTGAMFILFLLVNILLIAIAIDRSVHDIYSIKYAARRAPFDSIRYALYQLLPSNVAPNAIVGSAFLSILADVFAYAILGTSLR